MINKYKEKIYKIAENKHMFSVMNNTKWRELQNAIDDLPFPPPYIMKQMDEKSKRDFTDDVTFWGDWSDEVMTPFFKIEWIKVRPRYLKHRGMLVKHLIIDETEEFVNTLKEFSIPYEEENGTYTIYGYKNNNSKIIYKEF